MGNFFQDFWSEDLDKVLVIALGVFVVLAVVFELVDCSVRGSRRNKDVTKASLLAHGSGASGGGASYDGSATPCMPSVGGPEDDVLGTLSSRVGTLVFAGEEATLSEKPSTRALQGYATFVNKASTWAGAPKGVLRLDPSKPKDREALQRSERQIDGALDKLQRVRVACRQAGPTAKFLLKKTDALYRAIWLKLWRVKLMQWRENQAIQNAISEDEADAVSVRKWAIRITIVLIFIGLCVLFAVYVIPEKALEFRGAGVAILAFVLLGLQYLVLFLAIIFVPWSSRSKIRNQVLTVDDGVAFLVASHMSEPDVLEEVIRAARKRFSPGCIFICDNANTTVPNPTTKAVCDKTGVNYVLIPEGNKTFSFYWTARYWLGERFKYVMMIDDDVSIPANLEIPLQRTFGNPDVAAVAYTIQAAHNTVDSHGLPSRTPCAAYQHMEYSINGLQRLAQSRAGTALAAHGAIALWRRDILIKVLDDHNTMFHGEDLQMGLILAKRMPHMKIKFIASESVPTNVPQAFVYIGAPPPGLKSLFTQRVRSWEACAHRFLPQFIAFTFLYCWRIHRIVAHVSVLADLLAIIQAWLRPLLIVYFCFVSLYEGVAMTIRLICIMYILLIMFNYGRLSTRRDLRSPLWVVATFPIYQLFLLVANMTSLVFNAWVYAPTVQNKTTIKKRLDQRDCPPFLDGMEEFVQTEGWEKIWSLPAASAAEQPNAPGERVAPPPDAKAVAFSPDTEGGSSTASSRGSAAAVESIDETLLRKEVVIAGGGTAEDRPAAKAAPIVPDLAALAPPPGPVTFNDVRLE